MAPGSQDYMPPEALKESPIYDFKLDIFSVGHLTLYVAAQKYPVVHELDDMTMYAARRRAIEQIGGKRHSIPTHYPVSARQTGTSTSHY